MNFNTKKEKLPLTSKSLDRKKIISHLCEEKILKQVCVQKKEKKSEEEWFQMWTRTITTKKDMKWGKNDKKVTKNMLWSCCRDDVKRVPLHLCLF